MKISLILLLLLSPSLWARPTSEFCQIIDRLPYAYGVIENVIDGDTIKVSIELNGLKYFNNVRLLGIDAPETYYQKKSQGYWAERAKNSLAAMLKNKQEVLLEFEGKACDSYSRLIAKVKTHQYEVNLEQIKRGLATTYCYQNVTDTCLQYSEAMKEVMINKKGMYQDPKLMMPYLFRYSINPKARSAQVMNLMTGAIFDFEEIHLIPPHLIVFIPWSR